MFSTKKGDTLLRVTPPSNGFSGYCQAGVVSMVTDEFIEILVQADVIRRMRFSRQDGRDMSGLGSFVVIPDTYPTPLMTT
jgi:hypothetical protein